MKVRPPERVRHLCGADTAVPLLPRASAGVGTASHGLMCDGFLTIYQPVMSDVLTRYGVGTVDIARNHRDMTTGDEEVRIVPRGQK